VHHVERLDAEAGGEEGVLRLAGVDEHRVDVAILGEFQGLAGADRDHVDADPVRRLERRQEDVEEAGVDGRGGRREAQHVLAVAAAGAAARGSEREEEGGEAAAVVMLLLYRNVLCDVF
jgi:hypothetical protein